MSWRKVALKNLGQIIGGGTPSTKEPLNFGDDFPWITPKDLSRQGQRYIDHGERGISIEGRARSSAKLLPAGSVIVSSRAPIGLTAIAAVPVTTNQGCRSFVPGEDADSLFMYYLLGSMTDQMERLSNGSTFKEISGSTLAGIEVSVPDLEEQRVIAATLGALDDKIESNRRAQTLGEELIRSLVTAALERSDGGIGVLGDYCDLIKDHARNSALTEDVNYIGFEHMPRGSIFLDSWGNAAGLGSDKSNFLIGDVLFGKLRPYFKKVGIAPVNGVCSTDILVLRPKLDGDGAIVAVVASSDSLIDSLSAAATGTRMPRASWKDLSNWPVVVLTAVERSVLAEQIAPLLQRLAVLTYESKHLRLMRDTLLPELLSGRILVPEAAEVLA